MPLTRHPPGAILFGENFPNDDEEYDDYWTAIDDEKKDFDFVGALEEWAGAFAGGLSVIEQIPIGDHFSFGIEQYIARNVWIGNTRNKIYLCS